MKSFHSPRHGRGARARLIMSAGVIIGSLGLMASVGAVAASAATPKQALANITIGDPVSNVNVLPIWVGQQQGTFTKYGLNVKQVTLTAATIHAALVSNSVQFIGDNSAPFLLSRQQGIPLEAISEWDNGQSVGFIVSTKFAQEHNITAKTPVTTVMKYIPGSTGGSSSPATTGQAYVLLRSYGIQPSQVTEASFSSLPSVVAALSKGSIDWFVASEPQPLLTQSQGFGLVVATAQNSKAWAQKTLNQVLETTNAYAAANPGITRNVVRAIDASVLFIHNHEQQSVTAFQQNSPGISRPILLKAIQSLVWPTSGKMNTNIWRSTINFGVRSGQLTTGVHVTENVDWTNKYVTH